MWQKQGWLERIWRNILIDVQLHVILSPFIIWFFLFLQLIIAYSLSAIFIILLSLKVSNASPLSFHVGSLKEENQQISWQGRLQVPWLSLYPQSPCTCTVQNWLALHSAVLHSPTYVEPLYILPDMQSCILCPICAVLSHILSDPHCTSHVPLALRHLEVATTAFLTHPLLSSPIWQQPLTQKAKFLPYNAIFHPIEDYNQTVMKVLVLTE